jgi:hypothetical protein
MRRKPLYLGLLAAALLAAVGLGLLGWSAYRRARAGYDAYRARIQPGISVAGVPVGGLTAQEAEKKVSDAAAAPYYRDFTLYYENEPVTLSPGTDLAFEIPVKDLVGEAVAASHQYDYWGGFWKWITGSLERKTLDVPLKMAHDESAAAEFMAGLGQTHDQAAVEPMIDMKNLAFIPGRPGRSLDVAAAARMVEERVDSPTERQINLPITLVEPDQSPARIESMIGTLGPVMERAPGPPRFYTATLPISTTGGIEGTPTVTYTGELTWTFPHFAGYTGSLTETYAYFFDPGVPGLTFDVEKAVKQVEDELAAGVTTPITFQPDWLPAPPMKPSVLVGPLKARLARFPGFSSLLIKNLDTGQVIYDSNNRTVLAGMSVVKIGIMAEVYRYYNGKLDAQTYDEVKNMMGVESCNPCANRLMAAVGDGSAVTGAKRVTASMQRLGLSSYRICGPYQVVGLEEDTLAAGALREQPYLPAGQVASAGPFAFYSATPRYDPCVKATPGELSKLLELIYQCSQGKGTLTTTFPQIKRESCQEMIDIMAANDLRNMLGAGVQPDVKLAHKHGFAAASWGDTRAEVGIVFSPGATYLVTFYLWQDTDWINFGIVQPLYRDVSNMIYNFFNPGQPFWPRPPWTP